MRNPATGRAICSRSGSISKPPLPPVRLFKDLAGKFATWEQSGAFCPGLFAWHAGLAGWLLAVSRIYQAQIPIPATGLTCFALILATILWVCGLQREFRPDSVRALPRLPTAAGLGSIAFLGLACMAKQSPTALPALWFGGMLVLLATLSNAVIHRLAASDPVQRPGVEALRCLILAGLVALVYYPLYIERPSGAGDAYWYKLMLADFITQVRATGLPVWAGQTEYAFNGAVIPLRMAPWFQHIGALVDWLSGRSLDYVAVANLVLALNALAGAFSAYFCFRAVVPRQPWSALAIAFLYVASPAVLSPLAIGDQYMTFLTTPLLPVAGYALWRICSRDQTLDYLLLAAGLAALWLSHPPIGLCMCFFAAIAGGARLLLKRGVRWQNVVIAAVAFGCLGSLPFASVLSLGPPGSGEPLNSAAISSNRENYPAVLLPLTSSVQSYQPGYSALLLGVLGLGVFVWRRTVPAGVHLFLAGVVCALVLPVPWINAFLWNHVPGAAMQVLNAWPIQRLVGIGVILVLTLGVGSLALLESAGKSWLPAACFWGLLLPAAGWTGWESHYLTKRLIAPNDHTDNWRSSYAPHNLVLTRYAFNPFPAVPSYYSHGYMDPVLEHRLLRRDFSFLASNAEAAVRHGGLRTPDPTGTALLAHGTWRAVNDNLTTFYNLAPRLSFPAQQHLALWIEPLEPGQRGWLQILGRDVHREYILPDSGVGVANRHTLRGFGTLPSSSKIISLFTRDPHETPLVIDIAPEHTPAHTDFDFARYELWQYDPKDLPVVVNSWAPYHLTVHSPVPAYVETPRAWLPHYRARVNGQYFPGVRSPDGLVMFPVQAGESDITIKYIPPLWLELIYWLNLGSWIALFVTGLVWLLIFPGRPADRSAQV